MKKRLIYIIGGSVVAGSLMFGGPSFVPQGVRPAIFGLVTEVEGTNVTVSGKSGRHGTTTTYTVDTSHAQITAGFGRGASPVSPTAIAVGDKVAVLGVA